MEYPLILEIQLKLFQKQYNSLIKIFFPIYKKGKAQKGWSSAPNNTPTLRPCSCFSRYYTKRGMTKMTKVNDYLVVLSTMT